MSNYGQSISFLKISSFIASIYSKTLSFPNPSSDDVTKHMSAQAFIVKNSIQTITVNFFVKVFKPKVPLKMFSTISEAEPWIQGFVAENISLKKNI